MAHSAQAGVCFHCIVEHHLPPVFRFLYRFVDDPVIAEGLAQEVFLQAHKALVSGALPARCDTWLFRRALQLAPRNGISPGTFESTEPGSLVMLIRRAMAALPEAQRAAVLMHKYETFDYSQIAHVLGCSDSRVQLLLREAYQNLRAQVRAATS